MLSALTECSPNQLSFGRVKGRKVIADFKGGALTSDGGLVLIAELDKKRQITARFGDCFSDYRHQGYVEHSVADLVAQRIYGLIQGYEDLNDHERLPCDPVFTLALGKLSSNESESVALAGKSTLNRLEYCPETVIAQAEARYHRISHEPKRIKRLLLELFLESYRKPPRSIVIDLDVTDDSVHGSQEQGFFNTYYGGVCYAPLYIFCGHHLLAAKLRPSNVDPADGALEELQRVIGLIRERWEHTHILIRGDSAYSRDEIMSWCEDQTGVDYVFGMATNSQLRMKASDVIAKGKAEYEQRLSPVTSLMEELFSPNEDLTAAGELVRVALWYRSLTYKTQNSWSRAPMRSY